MIQKHTHRERVVREGHAWPVVVALILPSVTLIPLGIFLMIRMNLESEVWIYFYSFLMIGAVVGISLAIIFLLFPKVAIKNEVSSIAIEYLDKNLFGYKYFYIEKADLEITGRSDKFNYLYYRFKDKKSGRRFQISPVKANEEDLLAYFECLEMLESAKG